MSGFDPGALWQSAEAFVRRHWKSKAVREAERRRQERKNRNAMAQARRGLAAAGVSGGAVFAAAAVVAPPAIAAIAAGGAAVAGIAAVQIWVARRRAARPFSREELAGLPGEAEDWLLDRRLILPVEAREPYDSILSILGDLPPHLAGLEPNSTLAWDARRLIGEHLPGLVETWARLPTIARDRDPEAKVRLLAGLATLETELADLCREASRDTRMWLETQERYLESRYRDRLGAG